MSRDDDVVVIGVLSQLSMFLENGVTICLTVRMSRKRRIPPGSIGQVNRDAFASTFNDIHSRLHVTNPIIVLLCFGFHRRTQSELSSFRQHVNDRLPGKIVNAKIEKLDNALKIKKTVVVFYLLTSVSSEN